MDLTLLWLTLALFVIGFVLVVIGERMKPPAPGVEIAEPPSWDEIIRTALGHLLTGIGQIVNGPSLGHRVQGIGSGLVAIGAITLVAWIVVEVLPELTDSGDGDGGASPSPSVSA
ncbi:MAG: hypothetical protein ACC726_11670 [Chloroflexota bacterium]